MGELLSKERLAEIRSLVEGRHTHERLLAGAVALLGHVDALTAEVEQLNIYRAQGVQVANEQTRRADSLAADRDRLAAEMAKTRAAYRESADLNRELFAATLDRVMAEREAATAQRDAAREARDELRITLETIVRNGPEGESFSQATALAALVSTCEHDWTQVAPTQDQAHPAWYCKTCGARTGDADLVRRAARSALGGGEGEPEAEVACPECDGKGGEFEDRGGCTSESLPCESCRGTGSASSPVGMVGSPIPCADCAAPAPTTTIGAALRDIAERDEAEAQGKGSWVEALDGLESMLKSMRPERRPGAPGQGSMDFARGYDKGTDDCLDHVRNHFRLFFDQEGE